MNTKEEKNVDIEQIIKETESRLKALSEDELTKVSGGNNNGVSFEKGKWIEIDGMGDPRTEIAFELLELNGNSLLTNMWVKIGHILIHEVNSINKGICLRNQSIPIVVLSDAIEIPKPDWADE